MTSDCAACARASARPSPSSAAARCQTGAASAGRPASSNACARFIRAAGESGCASACCSSRRISVSPRFNDTCGSMNSGFPMTRYTAAATTGMVTAAIPAGPRRRLLNLARRPSRSATATAAERPAAAARNVMRRPGRRYGPGRCGRGEAGCGRGRGPGREMPAGRATGPGRRLEGGLEEDEVPVALDQEGDDRLVGVAGVDAFPDQRAHVLREVGVRIEKGLVLADHAAQLRGEGPDPGVGILCRSGMTGEGWQQEEDADD